ncbi:MAG: S-methyl thiohydantoin desulfurase domain-containing protein [Sulfuriferula sp.]
MIDFQYIAAGAAILGSGGGGSYCDAVKVLEELADSGWSGAVSVRDYDSATNCCVLALMGSPDAADNLTLADIGQSITNTVSHYQTVTGTILGCVIAVEIGPINSIVPLIAATLSANSIQWVVNGDGAGRAVPELPQTTYSGCATLAASPCVLANNAKDAGAVQSAALTAATATQIARLAGGVVPAFGSYSGIAMWSSSERNGYALTGNYLVGTLAQIWALGQYLLIASSAPSTAEVAAQITALTGREATPTLTNFYITAITQSTTQASLDTGIIRLDNTLDQAESTETYYIYNLNENLIMYSSLSSEPDIIAPDSICYYSESTARGFSNATNDLEQYFDARVGKSTGKAVSVIKVAAVRKYYKSAGVIASFAGLLRNMGYAGALPYS